MTKFRIIFWKDRLLSLLALSLLACAVPAAAQDPGPGSSPGEGDFDPSRTEWNGLSELIEVGREAGIEAEVSQRLDVGQLRPEDSLFLVHPEAELPTLELTAFLRAGGRLVLADDFGRGEQLLSAFRITRTPASAEGALRLRGNSELLVARPAAQHPLMQGVSAIVTNHPQAIVHSDLDPIFSFGGEQALVLAGAVEGGRLVALSDPSVLINNMMRFRGNRAFAKNLFRYLRDERQGRVFLVVGEGRVVGRYGTPGADRPLHDLRASLESLAAIDVPPVALTVGTLALIAVFGLVAFGSLPRRSPYAEQAMFAQKAAQGGFLGRVRYFTRDAKNLLSPLMVYKFELEAVLIERLGLTGRTPLREVMAELRERGVPERDVEALRALLIELNELWDRQDIPPDPPMVKRRRFLRMVATGERVLKSAEEVMQG